MCVRGCVLAAFSNQETSQAKAVGSTVEEAEVSETEEEGTTPGGTEAATEDSR